jgi:hypothetical protein
MQRALVPILLLLTVVAPSTGVLFAESAEMKAGADARLEHAFRRPAQNGWVFVHLQGTPAEIGFQHGYLLAPEIADALRVTIFETDA